MYNTNVKLFTPLLDVLASARMTQQRLPRGKRRRGNQIEKL